MFGWLKALKYRRKISELEQLVNEAKKMGLVEPDATPEQLMETLTETMKAKMTIEPIARPSRRRSKKEDDGNSGISTRRMDIDAYMAQQLDMVLNLFDKMFSLYERMDRKMSEISKKYQQNRVGRNVEEEKKETFEDRLIEKIVEQYLLGGFSSASMGTGAIGNVGGSGSFGSNEKDVGGEVLKELMNIGKRKDLVEKLEKQVEEEVVEDV